MRLADLIFQGRGVLKAENDAGFPFGFCAPDVGRGAHRGDQVGVVGKPALPLRNIAHRADEPLPDRACAIRGGQSAPSHVGKYRAAPFRDDETVYDGERVVQAGHVTFPEQFRERRAGWATQLVPPQRGNRSDQGYLKLSVSPKVSTGDRWFSLHRRASCERDSSLMFQIWKVRRGPNSVPNHI